VLSVGVAQPAGASNATGAESIGDSPGANLRLEQGV
jgi:hypothetical protein